MYYTMQPPTEEHLISMAERILSDWLSFTISTVGHSAPTAFGFRESGRLFRSDARRFLSFLASISGDSDYRLHWSLSRCRERSVHYRFYITPLVPGKEAHSATLRLRLYFGKEAQMEALTVIYRPERLIRCLSPDRLRTGYRRLLYSLRLYHLPMKGR